jgi:hypothetical protein
MNFSYMVQYIQNIRNFTVICICNCIDLQHLTDLGRNVNLSHSILFNLYYTIDREAAPRF